MTASPASPPAARPAPASSLPRTLARLALGAFLVLAGISHVTYAREAFRAQVPAWVRVDVDVVVLVSGVIEILLGLAILLLPRRRVLLGWVTAAFFVAVFPGNIS